MQIEWSESYNIGESEIDAKQQQLFALEEALMRRWRRVVRVS